ncbi:acyl-CoA dehydrogenase family protein [Variovorax boronicumulans]|uniref:acyl-CoA dehydrogenase family protein n=1 Tax=Variovorax boronicumulans TaxID=436515 RepID=UPI001C590583
MSNNSTQSNSRENLFSPEHELFRQTVRRFLEKEVLPFHADWEREGRAPREIWTRAGAAGLLLPDLPAEYGGGGGDFLHFAVLVEEIATALASGVSGFTTHSGVVAPYLLHFGTEEQKHQWLPRLASGEVIAAIAMTEPSAGSDVKAIRTTAAKVPGGYRLKGQKTFITNGWNADRVLVAAKTAPEAGRHGISLLWVDAHAEGFSKGAPLDKLGQKAQDTTELFFDDVFVPAHDRLGEENQAFTYLMRGLIQERLMVAMRCASLLEASLGWTVDYAKERQTFGKALIEHQHLRFQLAEVKTLAYTTRVLVDHCLVEHMKGALGVKAQ